MEEFHFRHVESGICTRYPTNNRKSREVYGRKKSGVEIIFV